MKFARFLLGSFAPAIALASLAAAPQPARRKTVRVRVRRAIDRSMAINELQEKNPSEFRLERCLQNDLRLVFAKVPARDSGRWR